MNKLSLRRAIVDALLTATVWTVFLSLAAAQTKELQTAVDKKLEALAMMKAMPLDEALIVARVQNKYSMLLRQIKVPKDADPAKPVIDFGARDLRDYAGHGDIPAGHWVYVYPYWYVWRD